MKIMDAYPPYAVGGSCFITKDYDVSNGKRVISLDVDVANLPARGMLCISEEAVRQMCVALGWATDVEGFAKLAEAGTRIADLESENASLRDAMQSVLSVQRVVAPTGDVDGEAKALDLERSVLPEPVEWEAVPAPPSLTDEQFVVVDPEPVAKKAAPRKKAAAKK